jgi:AcrR family transcriptional regulator
LHTCILIGVSDVKRRTRQAILAAAKELLDRGVEPSVGEVAQAAGVSRRTVYMHFTGIEQLLADAALEAAGRELIEPELEPDGDAPARLEAFVRAMQRNSGATEELGRIIIRHTLDAAPGDTSAPRRGFRRVEWIERALEQVREELPPKDFQRLVSALTLLVGWEATIVLRDLRGLTPKQAEDVSAWAAEALLRASLQSERG